MTNWQRLVLSVGVGMGALLLSRIPSVVAKGKPAGGGAAYTVVTLAPPNVDVWWSYTGDLNEAGDIVGFYEEINGTVRPFHYRANTQTFSTLNGGTAAMGLNNVGGIVGVDDSTGLRVGRYWHSSDVQPMVVPPLSGDTESRPLDVNDDGIITGLSIGADAEGSRDQTHAVAWQVQVGEAVTVSNPVDLGALPNDTDSEAYRINELSSGMATIVGISSRTVVTGYDGEGRPVYDLQSLKAVVWMVAIDEFGTLVKLSGPTDVGTPLDSWSVAHAVNNFDDVCGTIDGWPFLQPAGEAPGPLPPIRDATGGEADDVNDLGEVVGNMRVRKKREYQTENRAVLWRNGEALDLTTGLGRGSGWERLEHALHINNAGRITGSGINPAFGAGYGAFLLIPN